MRATRALLLAAGVAVVPMYCWPAAARGSSATAAPTEPATPAPAPAATGKPVPPLSEHPELWEDAPVLWRAADRPSLNCSRFHKAWGVLDTTCAPSIQPCVGQPLANVSAFVRWASGRTVFFVGDSHVRWLFGQLWCFASAAGLVAAMTRWQPWKGQEYIVFRADAQDGAHHATPRMAYTWDWNARNRHRLPLTCLELREGGAAGTWSRPPPWRRQGPGIAAPSAARVCLRALYKSSRGEVGRKYDHPRDAVDSVTFGPNDALLVGVGTHYRAFDTGWVHEGDFRADLRGLRAAVAAPFRGGPPPAVFRVLPSLPQFHPTTDGLDRVRPPEGGVRKQVLCTRPPAHATWRNVMVTEELGREAVVWDVLRLVGGMNGTAGTMARRSFGNLDKGGWFGHDCIHFCQDVYSSILAAALTSIGCDECGGTALGAALANAPQCEARKPAARHGLEQPELLK